MSGNIVVEKSGGKRYYIDEKYNCEIVRNAVRRHQEISRSRSSELIKATAKGALSAFPLAAGDNGRVYVKEFFNRGVVRCLETVFSLHRGKRAWNAARFLQSIEVPCPELIGLVEERKFGLPRASYLLMKEIPGALQLDHYLAREFFRVNQRLTREEIRRKRNLIHAGAAALRAFHAKRVYHKDLSAKNLLVKSGDGRPILFYCVDLDAINVPWRLSMRRKIKNLAQLNGVPGCVTATDKLRFYKQYFRLENLAFKDKIIIRLIRRLSRHRVEKMRLVDKRLKEELLSEEKSG
jgi:aminoglycoside phosphotransferase (APT) family kinase protein